MKKFTFLLMPLIVVACGKQPVNTERRPVPVRTLAIDSWDAQTEHSYVGTVESENSLTLTFPLGGTLIECPVKNGQKVKKGDLLARIDNTTAESLHETALATLRQAEDGYARLKKLHDGGGLSDVKWVEMETNLKKAQQAERSARKHLADCAIYAPQDGLLAGADFAVGQELHPMEVFARIMDLRHLRVSYSVPEKEIGNINKGDKVLATIPALNDCEIDAVVSDRSYVCNPLGHTYTVRAAFPVGELEGELLPGMVVKVGMQSTEHSGIVIPSSCVQTMANGLAVWTVKKGLVERRYITVKDFVRNGVLVDEGLSMGDTVVVEGYQKLYTGAAVSEIE